MQNYTVQKLAALAGVTPRTLRYYDKIGLLPPSAVAANGYRQYGPEAVRRLQEILFYRALGVPCQEIAPLLSAPATQRCVALQRQLQALRAERERLAALEQNLQHAILELKGEYTMKDTERFAGFKREMLAENQARYGEEIREKYGDQTVDAVNARLSSMTEADWQHTCELAQAVADALRTLTPTADPAAPEALALADLHRQWLCCYWTPGMYSKPAHAALAQMYKADERFAAHYDAIVPGGCDFLCNAIAAYCAQNSD